MGWWPPTWANPTRAWPPTPTCSTAPKRSSMPSTSRSSAADCLIRARADPLTSLALDEALRRGEAYANAGADILFIEAPESKEQMRKIGAAFDVPVLSQQGA